MLTILAIFRAPPPNGEKMPYVREGGQGGHKEDGGDLHLPDDSRRLLLDDELDEAELDEAYRE